MPAGHPSPLSVATFFPMMRSSFSHAREHRALTEARKGSSRAVHQLTVRGRPDRLRIMKKLLPLLLCISLAFFTIARATKPVHTPAAGEKKSFDVSDAEEGEAADDEETDQNAASADNDSMENASDDEGEDVS